MTHKIVRYYCLCGCDKRTIKKGLALNEALTHCKSSESNSKTATSKKARDRTKKMGHWFDWHSVEE